MRRIIFQKHQIAVVNAYNRICVVVVEGNGFDYKRIGTRAACHAHIVRITRHTVLNYIVGIKIFVTVKFISARVFDDGTHNRI